jgi:4-amino-4-deoxy-L-arabinose transferase-like glycosyltransferase
VTGRAPARILLLLAVAAALYLPSIWTRDLWNPDEPRYAETAREMIATGDYVVPHLNGYAYYEKPPLFFWLSIVAGAVPGVPPGAGGRLVAVLASAATLLLTWRIGALIMGEGTGTLAALLLSTSVLFWNLSQTGVIDPLLTLFCTLAIYGFARHLRGHSGGILLFYASCAGGMLAKGPVGLVIPGAAAVSYSLLDGGIRRLAAKHALWGLPLALAPVIAWLGAGAIRDGAVFVETMIVKQNLGRMIDAYVHPEPFYYFLIALPLALLPWTLFLPQALSSAARERICGHRPLLLPLAWFISGLIFFSLVSSKKTRYMLPLLPAASLLISGWIMRWHLDPHGRIRKGRWILLGSGLAGLILAGALWVILAGGPRALPESLSNPIYAPGGERALAAIEAALDWPSNLRILAPTLIFAASCAASARLALARRGEALTAFLSGWFLLLAMAGLLWVPMLNEIKSARGFADTIRPLIAGSETFYIERDHGAALNFYLPADHIPVVRRKAETRQDLERPGAKFIGSSEELNRLEEKSGIAFDERVCRRVGSRILCLASVVTPPI